MDDLPRGVKSAAKNIENEIPKIGSAIGETFKNITSKGSKKQTDDKTIHAIQERVTTRLRGTG